MFTITTVTHKTDDTHEPLIMLTNREGFKYLIGNVPEGAQRVLNENRMRLSKLKGILLTGTVSTWSQVGGLPGLFLTISDSTKNNVDLYTSSSKIASYIVATWRYFVFRKGVELRINDISQDLIADSNIIIQPIAIQNDLPKSSIDEGMSGILFRQLRKIVSLMFPRDTSKVNSRDPDSYKIDPSESDIHTHVKLPDVEILEPYSDRKSMNYLIRLLPVRGKFDPVKAKALGISPGSDFRNLTLGQAVQNTKGETIYPDQVIGKSKYFRKILVLDIPNTKYLKNTLDCEKFFGQDEIAGDESIGIVYHFLGDDIDFELHTYSDFLKKFPNDCKHIISHRRISENSLMFRESAIDILKLKCLQKECYNLPSQVSLPTTCETDIVKLRLLQQFHISSGEIKEDNSQVPSCDWSSLFDENVSKVLPDSNKEEILSDNPISLGPTSGSIKDQVHVVTLGTGSALPSIHRNVISTLIRVPHMVGDKMEFISVILDGGENTLGSLMRTFGQHGGEDYIRILKELSLIFLSHLHADHHLGIASLINKWFEINADPSKKLFIVAPWQYSIFLREWFRLENKATNEVCMDRIVFLSCEEFVKDRQPEFQQLELDEFEKRYENKDTSFVVPRAKLQPRAVDSQAEMFKCLHLKSFQVVRAIHCHWAYSTTMDFELPNNESFKLSYSGDTRPNPKFASMGYGSDLLVHESSLDNELIEEAIAKKHSTMIEALAVSRLMNCPRIILTHFSTRYSNRDSMLVTKSDFIRLSDDLQSYLSSFESFPNIFNAIEEAKSETRDFKDLSVCFAFDLMSVRYNAIGSQSSIQSEIVRIFQGEEEDLADKKEKDLRKQREKREQKRLERLALKDSKKKRRIKSDEK